MNKKNNVFPSFNSGLTNSSGIATITVTGITSNTTFTATYSNVSDTCTVTVGQTFDYLNDFSDATTVSDFANCNGNGSINKSISDGILTLTAANNNENSCYLTESYIEGDFRVTLKVTEYQYLGFKIGYNPDGTPTGTCAFDITWNYGWQLVRYTGVGYGKTTIKSISYVNWGTTGTWVFEYVSKTMKVYLDGTLKATLDLTSYDAIEGYLEFGMCCNRNNKLDEIQIEQL